MKKETLKITISRAMHVIKCSKCNAILASASEKMYLPNFSTCDKCNGIRREPSFPDRF